MNASPNVSLASSILLIAILAIKTLALHGIILSAIATARLEHYCLKIWKIAHNVKEKGLTVLNNSQILVIF